MDYRKLDAALAGALAESADADEAAFTVFIRTIQAPNKEQAALLQRRGVRDVTAGRQTFTATLSPQAVAELSEQPWVRSLRLSQKLRLLPQD